VPFCANCGRELSPAAIACPNCGHPGPAAASRPAGAGKRTEGFAIASIVCSITSFFLVPVIGGILGITFGRIARKRIAENPTLGGDEVARVGIILGWIGLGLSVLFIMFLILLATAFRNWNF
jgi:hypothetical protein